MDPPALGTTAISVDAAVNATRGLFGTGCVLRDHRGFVISSAISCKHLRFSPVLAEASAVLHGIAMAVERGLSNVVVQSDCLEVVRALESGSCPTTELGTILSEIKIHSMSFLDFKIAFIRRSCNVVVHNLARFAIHVNSEVQWLGVVPPCAM